MKVRLVPKDLNNKICFDCKIEKHRDEFSIRQKSSDGLCAYCRECNIKRNKNKDWYKKQYSRNKEYKKQWEKQKYSSDINHKLKSNTRCRINNVLKRQKLHRDNTTLEYLGCTLEKYKQHISSQFEDYMTWENHGILWEVDHIIPCNSFDFNIEENIYICFNYKNTRPYNKSKNRSKKDKLNYD